MAVEWLRNSAGRHSAIAAEKIHPGGVFEAIVQNSVSQLRDDQEIPPTSYRLYFRFPDGNSLDTFDAYAFPPLLTDYDLYLSGEGTHYQKYEKLGAHVREMAGVRGVHFGVWAPNALRVSVVGDFNFWDGRVHPMRMRGETGIWEIFIPGLDEGTMYKFEIRSRAGILGIEIRSLRIRRRKASQQRFRCRGYRQASVERRGVAHTARLARLAALADVNLRSASRLVAAKTRRRKSLAHLSRTRR